MELFLVDPFVPDEAVIARAARILIDGGIVAYPTDTLYGLAIDPRNASAVGRLFAVKERPGAQAIPLIAADQAQVEREVGRMTALASRLAARFWPGPLTLVIEALPTISRALLAGTRRVAVRVPDHAAARMLAACVDCAITSTSANLSGQPAPASAAQVVAALGDRVDAVIDGGPTRGGPPSTIVDVIHEDVHLVRPGAISWDEVRACARGE
jgi:L-threonylcarbamoyladenylate synthase